MHLLPGARTRGGPVGAPQPFASLNPTLLCCTGSSQRLVCLVSYIAHPLTRPAGEVGVKVADGNGDQEVDFKKVSQAEAVEILKVGDAV